MARKYPHTKELDARGR